MKKLIGIFCLLFFPLLTHAVQPLPAQQVFIFSSKVAPDHHTLQAEWKIAPGYHLYRDRFTFTVTPADAAKIGSVTLLPGIPKEDNILGKYQIYENNVTIPVPLIINKPGPMLLTVNYQGCADAGFCYPPVTQRVQLNSDGTGVMLAAATTENASLTTATTTTKSTPSLSEQDKITRLLAGNNWHLILLGFFGFGLLLAFTPCVLPMIPILSSIIVGEGKSITVPRAFALSLTYVLAMAITYAGAGVLAALAGSYVQAFLQSPLVIVIFSGVFVLLALSLFGLYELHMPHFLHHHVTRLSNKQSGGTYLGVAVMGCLSTLILSPCVTAPLIGALSYIGKNGNPVLGGSALFAMGLGMGIPLLLIGTLGGEFLPKAGNWMHTIKAIFGVLMLGMAILLLSRILSPHIIMLLWAILLIMTATYMGAFTATPQKNIGKLWKGTSLLLLMYGFLILVGASLGNTDPFQPLALKQTISVTPQPQTQAFQVVKSMDDIQLAMTAARAENKPVLLDFYADWCIACKEMDREVFNNPAIQRKLNGYVLLRADVTANDANSKAIEKHFDVIAPPTILFFDAASQELTASRIVGAVGVKEMLNHLQQCSTHP
jgi:thiol:disulfide interchange protein DsbD